MPTDERTLSGGSHLDPTQVSDSPGIQPPGPQPTPGEEVKGRPSPEKPPFRPPSESPKGPFPAPHRPVGGETVLMHAEPEPTLPLAWLVIVEGPGGKRGTIMPLKAETVVGRTQGTYLLSGDRTVSSQHVRIRLETVGEDQAAESNFALYDLDSSNGTFVGTRQTYRDEPSRVYRCELKDGDYLLLGETTLVFKRVA